MNSDKIPVSRRSSDVRRNMQARHAAAIQHWVALMPDASNERIAAFADTSAVTVSKWRKARAGTDRPDSAAVDAAKSQAEGGLTPQPRLPVAPR